MKLWQIGLLVFLLAGVLNAVFVNFDIGGLPRELARLSVLIGLVILVVGVIQKPIKRYHFQKCRVELKSSHFWVVADT